MYNLLGIILLGFLRVGIAGQSPEISFSASAISPRLYSVESEEGLFWRTTLEYNQQFSDALQLRMSLAGSPETYRQDQTLQVYNASLSFTKKAFGIDLGRISDWSPFTNLRFDGARVNLNPGRLGRFTAGGGLRSTFLSNESADAAYFLSWALNVRTATVSARYWSVFERSYIGGYAAATVAGFRVKGLASFNLDDSSPSYTRVTVLKGFGNHRISVGYRQFRKTYFAGYPWKDEGSLELPPMVSFGYFGKFGGLTAGIQNFTRLSEEGANFIRGSADWNNFFASLHLKTARDLTLSGGTFGWKGRFMKTFTLGLSGSVNSFEFDGISMPKNSSGAYSWIAWQPNSKLALRIFTRFYQNSYYEQDGRGGVSIRVAL